MSGRLIYFSLLLLLLADLGFSFAQYYTTPLDGDMAGGIVPAESVREVLASPLGLDAILNDRIYSNPNRFVCHWSFKAYFSSMPFFLQRFMSPADSVYCAAALAKLAVHASLLYLLSAAVTGSLRPGRKLLLAALLITPLFQANGYRIYMGIIDPSVTYVFFYAMPAVLVLACFLPLFLELYHGKKPMPLYLRILWIPLGLAACLSGPLNPGIVLVAAVMIGSQQLAKGFGNSSSLSVPQKLADAFRSIPSGMWLTLFPVSLFALYSLFLGKYNYISIVNELSPGELYLRLPSGIYYLLTQKPGMALMLIVILSNVILIRRNYRSEGRNILHACNWIGIFALMYILLLPLGGYREYRSNVLRYDTIMPVTLGLMFLFSASSLFLLRKLDARRRPFYGTVVTAVLLIFTNADRGQWDRNACERQALKTLAASPGPVVKLHTDCTVLAWGKITKPEDAELNARLLQFWKITGSKKLYYQE